MCFAGMDPDLLIFGKSFHSNVQVLPQLATINISDLSGTDKRQFNWPQMDPSSSAHPIFVGTSPKTSTNTPTFSFPISTPPPISVYFPQDNQNTIPDSAIQISTTLKRPSQLISTHIITNPSTDPTIVSATKASPAPWSTMQPSFSFTNRQTSSIPQPTYTSSITITPSQLSSQLTSSSTSSTQVALLGTTTTTASTEFKTMPYLTISTASSSGHTTTPTTIPLTSTLESSTVEFTTMPVPLTSTPESSTVETTTIPIPLTATLQSSTQETATLTVPLSGTLQSSAGKTKTVPVPLSSTPQSSAPDSTTMPVLLSSILQSNKGETTAHPTLAKAQLNSANESLTLTQITPVKTTSGYVTTTTRPQVMTNIFTTYSWSYNQPINTQSKASPLIEKRITPSSTTNGLSQAYTNINLVTTDVSVNTIRPTTLNRLHTPAAASKTNSSLNSPPTTPTIVEDSQPYPNDTKGYISRNVTTGNSPQPVSNGGLMQMWHLAANTVLVALATCAALACGCCCSVLMAASWRGRRRRKGRFQTTLRGKKGSMRLIKYVFVRESS